MNTFVFLNSKGEETLVKVTAGFVNSAAPGPLRKFNWCVLRCLFCAQFHLYPKLGAKFMTDEVAQAVGQKNMRHR